MPANITVKNLPNKLTAIPNLRHAIYPDDIYIWRATSNPEQQEGLIQIVVHVIHQHTKIIGIERSLDKYAYVAVINHT